MLVALSGLPSLTFIDFTSQRLYGPLPANVTFPKLKFLGLGYNLLQVCIPYLRAHAWSGPSNQYSRFHRVSVLGFMS